MKEKHGFSGLKGATSPRSPQAPEPGLSLPTLRTGHLQQKPAKARESDPIVIGSGDARRGKTILTRSRRETVTFRHSFRIKGIDRQLPPGAYEELIEGLSFPCFRRTATMIMVPGAPPHRQSIEMLSISSIDLADAQAADAVASR
jgi:hypothetical protein